MESKIENQNQTELSADCKSGWTDDEKKAIAALVWPMAEMQKAYGRKIDAKLIMQGWQAVLSDKYNGAQICHALKEYALKGGEDFPSPKNLNDILDPPEPRISHTAYMQACKEYEAGGFQKYSDAWLTKTTYEKQNQEDFAHHETNKRRVGQIGGNEQFSIGYMGATNEQ